MVPDLHGMSPFRWTTARDSLWWRCVSALVRLWLFDQHSSIFQAKTKNLNHLPNLHEIPSALVGEAYEETKRIKELRWWAQCDVESRWVKRTRTFFAFEGDEAGQPLQHLGFSSRFPFYFQNYLNFPCSAQYNRFASKTIFSSRRVDFWFLDIMFLLAHAKSFARSICSTRSSLIASKEFTVLLQYGQIFIWWR